MPEGFTIRQAGLADVDAIAASRMAGAPSSWIAFTIFQLVRRESSTASARETAITDCKRHYFSC
jgi:hypothetical protein